MGIAEDIRMNILKRANIISNFGRDAIASVKKAVPGIVSGVKKGLKVGRQVVDVSDKVLRNIRKIPALSRQIDRLPIKPEEVIQGARGVINTVEDGIRLGEDVYREFEAGNLTMPKIIKRGRAEAERLFNE